jgi:hypothetical protein
VGFFLNLAVSTNTLFMGSKFEALDRKKCLRFFHGIMVCYCSRYVVEPWVFRLVICANVP